MVARILIAPLLCLAPLLPTEGRAEDPAHFFETQVRPLLAKRCFECHGEAKQQGDMRLDQRTTILGEGENEGLVVPGRPDESRLLQVLKFDPYETQMPPAGKLPDAEIAILTTWITQGAYWPESIPATGNAMHGKDVSESHWAFQPIEPPVPPDVVGSAQVQTPIDRFLLARLEAVSLGFSPPADKRTLIRRATFDLIGLPPSPEEVESFVADESPDAFSHLIDRLLASPHYGERWGRHWLDVARYADTKGYVFQEDIHYPYAYTYRDYVVDAFNQDKPFDRFVVEQLAADQLGLPEDARELAALGFLTVGRRNLNNRADIIDDRIDVTTRGLMGLTVACARCHDHKFDPIPTADYYSLYGVFDSCDEPSITELPIIATPPQSEAYAKFEAELAAKRAEVAKYHSEQKEIIERELREQAEAYLNSILPDAKPFEGARNVAIPHWKANLQKASDTDLVWGLWKRLSTHGEPETFAKQAEVEVAALRALPEFQLGLGKFVVDSIAAHSPTSLAEVNRAYGSLLTSIVSRPDPQPEETKSRLDALDAKLRETGAPFAISDDELPRYFRRDENNRSRELRKKVDTFIASSPVAPARAMVMTDRAQPAEPVIFERGNPGRRGAKVPRQFLEMLSEGERQPFPKDSSGRLEMARMIASPTNPLTARVIVNRVWQHHFGRGLVESTSDFGLQSDPPSHPELLDWLASEFIRGGWSIKKLHRDVMMSSAYQQASLDRSRTESQILTSDPLNLLIWRMNPKRLEFEAMRDATMAVAGKLDPELGGRPIRLFEDKSQRRTIYGLVNRNDMPGVRRNFDFPTPDATVGERPRTTVPQQALFGMNSPFAIEQAQGLASDPEIATRESAEEKVRQLYRRVLQRVPTTDEEAMAVAFLQESGPGTGDGAMDRLAQLAQILLMCNEFYFIE